MNFSFEERNEEIKGKQSFEEISFPILVRYRRPHPTGVVMRIGYADPGWEGPKAGQYRGERS